MITSTSNKYEFRPYGKNTVLEDTQEDSATMLAKAKVPHHPVISPSHYTSHPSGVECIQITEHMSFNLGNVVKYLWRAGLKDSQPQLQDLEKAAWYLQREIDRLKK